MVHLGNSGTLRSLGGSQGHLGPVLGKLKDSEANMRLKTLLRAKMNSNLFVSEPHVVPQIPQPH